MTIRLAELQPFITPYTPVDQSAAAHLRNVGMRDMSVMNDKREREMQTQQIAATQKLADDAAVDADLGELRKALAAHDDSAVAAIGISLARRGYDVTKLMDPAQQPQQQPGMMGAPLPGTPSPAPGMTPMAPPAQAPAPMPGPWQGSPQNPSQSAPGPWRDAPPAPMPGPWKPPAQAAAPQVSAPQDTTSGHVYSESDVAALESYWAARDSGNSEAIGYTSDELRKRGITPGDDHAGVGALSPESATRAAKGLIAFYKNQASQLAEPNSGASGGSLGRYNVSGPDNKLYGSLDFNVGANSTRQALERVGEGLADRAPEDQADIIRRVYSSVATLNLPLPDALKYAGGLTEIMLNNLSDEVQQAMGSKAAVAAAGASRGVPATTTVFDKEMANTEAKWFRDYQSIVDKTVRNYDLKKTISDALTAQRSLNTLVASDPALEQSMNNSGALVPIDPNTLTPINGQIVSENPGFFQRQALAAAIKAMFGAAPSNMELQKALDSGGYWGRLQMFFNTIVDGGRLPPGFVASLAASAKLTGDLAEEKLELAAGNAQENIRTGMIHVPPERRRHYEVSGYNLVRGMLGGKFRREPTPDELKAAEESIPVPAPNRPGPRKPDAGSPTPAPNRKTPTKTDASPAPAATGGPDPDLLNLVPSTKPATTQKTSP
jgi:hypothetical protein